MIEADHAWIRLLLQHSLIQSPVLELGTGYGGQTARAALVAAGLQHCGSDLHAGPGVDYVADFEQPADLTQFQPLALGSVVALNVLEHTFDPLRVLDHAVSILRPGGTCVVAAPAVWPLHDYPFDACRLLPNFYEQYAKRRGLELDADSFHYIGYGRVRDHRLPDGSYAFPRPTRSHWHDLYSRVVQKIFNTTGRHMFFPAHVCVGAVLRKPN